MIVLRATRRLDPWLVVRGGLVLVAVLLADLALTLTIWWETHKPTSSLGASGVRFSTYQEARGAFGGIDQTFDLGSGASYGTDRMWDRVTVLSTLSIAALGLCFLLRGRRELTRRNLVGLAGCSAVVVLGLLPFSGSVFHQLAGSIGWFGYGPS